MPVVMLSARGAAADRVYGISEGADDYLAKPFSPAELVVRVKAVLRRTAPRRDGEQGLALDDLEIDLDRMEVRRGRMLALTPAEFRLLAALAWPAGACSPDRRCSTPCTVRRRAMHWNEPWTCTSVACATSCTNGSDPRYIVTVRGADTAPNARNPPRPATVDAARHPDEPGTLAVAFLAIGVLAVGVLIIARSASRLDGPVGRLGSRSANDVRPRGCGDLRIAMGVAVVVSAVLSVVVALRLARPLDNMSRAARRIAAGDYGRECHEPGRPRSLALELVQPDGVEPG